VRDGEDGQVLAHEPAQPASGARSLADAIVALAADGSRLRSMGEAAATGAERFAIPRRIGETVALYREVLGRTA
jgi:hypothetical protein